MCLDELIAESDSDVQESTTTSSDRDEVEEYFLHCSVIPHKEDALQWWKNNSMEYPILSQLARKFLSGPCSSVESERMFSCAREKVKDFTGKYKQIDLSAFQPATAKF